MICRSAAMLSFEGQRQRPMHALASDLARLHAASKTGPSRVQGYGVLADKRPMVELVELLLLDHDWLPAASSSRRMWD